jgi:nucleotide-binding universal stress UspA family protein
VSHDGSEMSDHALKHALYLAKISGAQLVILHIIESEAIPPSALLTFIQPEAGLKGAKEDLKSTFEEAARRMLDQRVRESKDGGIANVEYIIRAGKPVDEIVKNLKAETMTWSSWQVVGLHLKYECLEAMLDVFLIA